tara:strand:- start:12935 stop:13663 length:729 start_codon:yes stop_codon:yes gene_type:complete
MAVTRTTSGTTGFNLDLNNLIEEAFERCGSELRTGYDLRTARRSLNLLLIEWSNRGINMWTIDQGEILLDKGVITYDIPLDTVDLMDFVIRTGTGQNQNDIDISRISVTSYSAIPNKNAQGRPVQVWIDRKTGAANPDPSGIQYPTINVWPAPNLDNYYTFVYWRLRRMQDAGESGSITQDVPYRFLPAMVAGLAFHLSMKIPEAMQRIPMLKAEYEQAFQLAADEDREKASLRISPRIGYI